MSFDADFAKFSAAVEKGITGDYEDDDPLGIISARFSDEEDIFGELQYAFSQDFYGIGASVGFRY